MENKNCLSAIKSKYRNLTKKERQLADYVLENFEAVVPMSTAELARNAGAVLSFADTGDRVCRSVCISGFV